MPMQSSATRPADPPGAPPARDMAWIPGGTFRMGSTDFYPEEAPVHEVTVDGFWMDDHPVTVAEFRRFVNATGHVTLAEIAPEPADYPTPTPPCSFPARWSSSERGAPSTWTTTRTGGTGSPAPSGDTRRDRVARSTAASGIPSRMLPTTTHGRTPHGPARSSPPRPSGSSRRGAGWTARRTPGATSSPRRAARWPTPGRASSRGRTCCSTNTSGPHRSGRSRRTATACTTSPATSGNGRPITTRRSTPTRSSMRAAARAGRGSTRA